MQSLFLVWLFMAVAIFFFTGSPGMGQYRRQRELARRFPPAPPGVPEPKYSSEDRPYTNPSPASYQSWSNQPVGTGGDDLDEGISVEMPQEQPAKANPTPTMEMGGIDAGAQELLKAVIWSEILQPPLALRRPRH